MLRADDATLAGADGGSGVLRAEHGAAPPLASDGGSGVLHARGIALLPCASDASDGKSSCT